MVAHQEITLDVHDNSEQQQAEEQVAKLVPFSFNSYHFLISFLK